ncbi:DNA mismatch repair protein MutS [Tothia fuscella]|uniref:DNA mismatch repair protein MutS n=1 Tax=Tothia fuscella TaxID=1048955 RepID=A0A9P4NFH9_9PEZI|nr:DNA mismatch repair protein MutS [Tothia fuscella]
MPPPPSRASTSRTAASTSYPSNYQYATTTSRPHTRRSTARSRRPSTGRPRIAASTIGLQNQQLVCALTESRGISPTVGLAFINLDTGEAALSQISDSQTYVRTINKLRVYAPSQILIPNTAASPPSKLFCIIEEDLDIINAELIPVDRRYYAETTGLECIHQLAFTEDIEAIKIAIGGNYFAVCCFAAALKFIEFQLGKTFPLHSLRVKYEPTEGSMMIDLSTISSLELIQNIQNPKSQHCLFGLLNETFTPMGARLLRSNILQPCTNEVTITTRYDAVEELTTKEDMFFAVRQALKPILDAEKLLTSLIIVPAKPTPTFVEQSFNRVIALKQFIHSIKPVYEALAGAKSQLLVQIQHNCSPSMVDPIIEIVDEVLNEDAQYAKGPLELRNQRTYAVKAGVNGFLDIGRQAYKEASGDAFNGVQQLSVTHNLQLELKYDLVRQLYIELKASELANRELPPEFINVVKKQNKVECQTLALMKINQKISNAHNEVLDMSVREVEGLIDALRAQMSSLFKSCESIGLLDMLASFAQLATTQDYTRPHLTDTLAIQAGRHPIREKIHREKFIPNDVYATQQTRFQIITGCNMSGKSTYIRSIAIMSVMAQIGSFVSASYASFPILHQLFARVNMDDSIEANVSTFAAEMRETAFILRNIDRRSMAIVDELGRGTSTRDGLAIALAIAEAFVESRALVWFATHFRDLAAIMAERNGVINLHLAVDMTGDGPNSMTMLYRIADGAVQDKHYGLQLAKVVPLPAKVFKIAETVAKKLESHVRKRKKTSTAVIHERKRKLVLNLKEHLTQAHNGVMQGEVLANWLRELQKEFVNRMLAIDAEAHALSAGSDEDEDEDDRVMETDEEA